MAEKMYRHKCLLLFSGGYDSLLAACRLIEQGYDLFLFTCNNGAELKLRFSVEQNAGRLKALYGERVRSLGIRSTIGIWRVFLQPYLLGKIQIQEYDLLPTEFICTTCRLSMYILSIALCNINHIEHLAEGARLSESFLEQSEQVMDKLKMICNKHSIDLLLPVYEAKSKGEVKDELMKRAVTPKTEEPFCILQAPLYNYKPETESLKGIQRLLDEWAFPRAEKLIEEQKKILPSIHTEEIV